MHKLYMPCLLREAAARGLLKMSVRRWLRKTPTDSSFGPSEEGYLRPFMFVDLQYVGY